MGRLRSPLPSPNPSPMSSPIPSPSRSRFQVSKVLEDISVSPSSSFISPSSSTNSSPSGSIGSSRFRVTAVRDSALPKRDIKSSSVPTSSAIVDKQITPKTPSNNFHSDIVNFSFNFDDTPTLVRSNIMDDSCSSLSSMDSIDRPINTTSSSNDDSSSLDNIIISPKAFSSTLVSESLSSQESFCENKLLSHLKAEDDDTLTNSPQRNQSSPIKVTNVDSSNQSKPVRERKKSILSGTLNKSGSSGVLTTPGNENVEPTYSHGIEKLLSIFRSNPITSTVSENNKKNSREEQPNLISSSDATSNTTSTTTTTPATTATRKDSPMGNFLALFKNTTNKTVPPDEVTLQHQPQIKSKSCSQILQHKLSDNSISDHSINPPSHLSQQNNPPHGVAMHVDNIIIPSNIHQEIKENISPENTITKDTLINLDQSMSSSQQHSDEEPHERVYFEVGGDDDDDEDDDDSSIIDTLTTSTATTTTTFTANTGGIIIGAHGESQITPPSSNESQNELSLNSKLGQIARDSLQILHHGGSNDSQESMRSLDLDPIESPSNNTEPNTSCINTPYHQINIQQIPKNSF